MYRIRRRWLTGLLAFLALAAIAAHAALNQTGAQPSQVRVIDGDTIQIDGVLVQLYGIDAPELGQLCYHGNQPWTCGLEAAFALHKLLELAQSPLLCKPAGDASDNAAVCEINNEVLAEVLTRQGHVVALDDGVAEYKEAEAAAKLAGLGIWGGEFVMPSVWRDGERLERGAESERCNIKALARDGRRIYYVPLDPGYGSLTLDLVQGDQLLCSDEQARRLGWKHDGETATPN